MKKLLLALVLVTLLFSTAAILPPELPSSYYGYCQGCRVGQAVTTNLAGKGVTFGYQGKVVYTINVEGGKTGQLVLFYVDGVRAGRGVYVVGGNQSVNLMPVRIMPVRIMPVNPNQ